MDSQDNASIIHKKARVAREDFDARAMSPAKALRLGMAKCADTLLGIAISVSTVEQTSVSAHDIPGELGDDGLLILLDGAGGQCGAVKLDMEFTAALIEAQIIGAVRDTPAQPRAYTRTDAAMVAPFLNAVLNSFDEQLQAYQEHYSPAGLRFGDKAEDARTLGLALEGGQFDMFRLTSDIENGAKGGVISFLVPHRPVPRPGKIEPETGQAAPAQSLEQNALQAQVALDAVVARLSLPLRDVCALKAGQVLTIAPESIKETLLVAPPRHLVAEVQLGQLNGVRAVRLLGEGAMMQPEPAVPEAEFEVLPDFDVPQQGLDPLESDPGLYEAPDDMASLSDLPDLPDMPGDLSGDLPELPGELPAFDGTGDFNNTSENTEEEGEMPLPLPLDL